MSTVISVFPAKATRQKAFLLLAFSAKTNTRRLTSPAPPGDFSCINGIRFLSALWVILGHRYIVTMTLPFMNLVDVSKVRYWLLQEFLRWSGKICNLYMKLCQ